MRFYWTFNQKILIGFGLVLAFVLAIALTSLLALHNVVASKDRVILRDAPALVAAKQMQTERVRVGTNIRMALLSGSDDDFGALQQSQKQFDSILADLKDDGDAEQTAAVVRIERAEADYRAAADKAVAMRRSGSDVPTAVQTFTSETDPVRAALSSALTDFIALQQKRMDAARVRSSADAAFASYLIEIVSVLAVLLGTSIAAFLCGSLRRQIGSAVQHVQSSSAELHSAANLQGVGVKEQVISLTEINTTIAELLATSRQISESARSVADIAGETATAADLGDTSIERAKASLADIRDQVDVIINHMVAHGKKSQEIGAILTIVSELAEQTNILSINATIEAAGAGDAGKRFSVVADEIRKLADRVAMSTKEIRALIDDVHASVNTTVMATETGSKAVDNGMEQFHQLASQFRRIAQLVSTTTEAAHEIKLSTKQQTSAVEQVNIAVASVTQATKSSEVSAGQTIQTASELASTSRNLLRLVKAA